MTDITPASLIQITPDQVIVADRLRAIDADYVELLANSMAESGQHTPIHVGPADADGRYRLIAGGHRHAAARLANLPLTARVFAGDALQQRMLEIDENLLRRELSELDRAVFLLERKRVWEALHPETAHGKGRLEQDDKNVVLFRVGAFSEDAAARLHLSRRQVERFVKRAQIEPQLRELLVGTRWADHGSTLDALARETPEKRRAMVLALTRADNPARNVSAAYLEATGAREPVRTEAKARESALASGWRKADKRARREFLASILGEPTTLELVEQLLTELRQQQERDETETMGAIGGRRRRAA